MLILFIASLSKLETVPKLEMQPANKAIHESKINSEQEIESSTDSDEDSDSDEPEFNFRFDPQMDGIYSYAISMIGQLDSISGFKRDSTEELCLKSIRKNGYPF